MKIDVMWEFVGVGSPSLDDNEPCNKFKNKGNSPQEDDDSRVSLSPFIFRTQDFQTFKHINDAHNDHTVSHGVMVNIPVNSVLVILIWPQKQSKNLFQKTNPKP